MARVRVSGKVADIVERFGAFMTYVIAAPNPHRLLHSLETQSGSADGIVWFGPGTGSRATHHLQGAFGAQYSPDVGLRRDQSQVFQEIQSGGHIPCLYGQF